MRRNNYCAWWCKSRVIKLTELIINTKFVQITLKGDINRVSMWTIENLRFSEPLTHCRPRTFCKGCQEPPNHKNNQSLKTLEIFEPPHKATNHFLLWCTSSNKKLRKKLLKFRELQQKIPKMRSCISHIQFSYIERIVTSTKGSRKE